ncbi:hypothetical protein [Paenibacillus fonticola]|nr:hypothetical protein [Paenibacillus fonticola]
MTYPSFPSVIQPYEELAKNVVALLVELMDKKEIDQMIYELDVHLTEEQ